MATLRKRNNGHWQARVHKANQSITKTFINKVDAKRWTKQVEVEMQKESCANLALAECTTFAEVIERYIVEALPTIRGGNTDFIRVRFLDRLYAQNVLQLNNLKMKKILMFQWFDCKDDIRRQEITDCIKHNLNIGFDEVIIYNDSVEPTFHGQNIKNISTNSRITYKDYIDVVKNSNNYGSLVVLTNTDIKLDKNILSLDEIIKEETLIALSRYENNGVLADFPWCTQDVWAMISQPIHKSVIHQCDIPLGLPGCEIRFSEIIFNTGFAVFNPCLDIKNIHVHSNQTPHLDENRMYGAYLFTPACTFEDIRTGNMKILPSPQYLTSFIPKLFSIQ